jgi:hypothetical protein
MKSRWPARRGCRLSTWSTSAPGLHAVAGQRAERHHATGNATGHRPPGDLVWPRGGPARTRSPQSPRARPRPFEYGGSGGRWHRAPRCWPPARRVRPLSAAPGPGGAGRSREFDSAGSFGKEECSGVGKGGRGQAVDADQGQGERGFVLEQFPSELDLFALGIEHIHQRQLAAAVGPPAPTPAPRPLAAKRRAGGSSLRRARSAGRARRW